MNALHDLYISTNGSQWNWEVQNITASGIPWNFTADANPCTDDWQGIICTIMSGAYHVKSLQLKRHNLQGPIPSSLGDLTYLQVLVLSENVLNCTLPETLSNVAGLQTLSLSGCRLSGRFPEVVTSFVNLTSLDLSVNTFTGPLPVSLRNLQQLQLLDVIDNLFSGPFNSAITDMISLQAIALSGNFFTGAIPESINRLTSLRFLLLSFNHMNGTLPSTLLNMQSLVLLQINRNSFSGTLSTQIGNMGNLVALDLAANDFSGTIPNALVGLTKLSFLYLNFNKFIGTIPSALGGLIQLQALNLDSNQLHGPIPSSLGLLPHLTEVTMFNNSLTGPIPHTFTGLFSLRALILSRNQLNGTLPDAFSSLSSTLETLIVDYNVLTGSLPTTWSALHRLKNFQASNNRLTGQVPEEYASLSNLLQIRLNNNLLTGSVPTVLLGLPLLQRLALKTNKLIGSLPQALVNASGLVELALSDNDLTGTIPDLFENLVSLQYLELDGNQLSGTVPLSLSVLSNLTELTINNNNLEGSLNEVFNPALQRSLSVVLVNDNAFSGTLPDAAFLLPKLTTFVGGSNCFHGSLPSTICKSDLLYSIAMDGLSSSPACGNYVLPREIARSYVVNDRVTGTIPDCLYQMTSLNTLHLSGNGLTGTLPTNLTTSPVLLYLSLSNNLLRGTIPRAFQEKQWKQLDLSYNRIGGTLLTAFATAPTNESQTGVVNEIDGYTQEVIDQIVAAIEFDVTGTVIIEETLQNLLDPQRQGYDLSEEFQERGESLHLQNNRLSGLVPLSIMDRANISMLGSNMFACKHDKSNLPQGDHDTATYNCGSTAFDVTYYIWLANAGVAIAIVLFVWRYRSCVERYVGVEYVYQHIVLWLGVFSGRVKYTEYEGQYKLDNVYAVNHLLTIVIRITMCCVAFIVLLLGPMYLILSLFYSMYVHEYAWVISAAFLSGYVAVMCEIVLLIVTLLIMQACVVYLDRFVDSIQQTKIDEIMSEKVFSVPAYVQRRTKFLVYTVFSILNFIIVMSVNTAFIYVSLNASNAMLLFAQVWLSVFKVLWNNTFITQLLRAVHVRVAACLHNGTEFSETRYVTIQVYTAIFNNIVIPCIVVAIVSTSCYYNIFVADVHVEAFFTRDNCLVYDAHSEECILNKQQVVVTHYSPPFAYSYQCSFSLITNYAPAFVVLCFVTTFVVPAVSVTGQQLLRRATPGTRWFAILDYSLPRILKLPTKEAEDDAARLTRLTRINSLQFKTHEAYDDAYFDVNKLVINILTQLAIMLTFGAMFPPLAVAVGVSIFATVYFEKVKVGRFLTAAFRAKLFTFVHIIELECQELGCASKLLKRSVRLLIIVKCCFYTMVIFDTLGDQQGISHAFWVLIVVPLLPLVLYAPHWAITAWRERGNSRDAGKSRCAESLGANTSSGTTSDSTSEGGIELQDGSTVNALHDIDI